MASDSPHLSIAHQGHKGWTETSSAYTKSVGSTTALAAVDHVTLLHQRLPLSGHSTRAIDVGAGTGSVTLEIIRRFPRLPIIALDISEGMLSELTKAHRAQAACTGDPNEEGKGDFLTTMAFDICSPSMDGVHDLAAGTYTHLVSAYMLQIVLDPQRAMHNMYKLLQGNPSSGTEGSKPCGAAVIAIWDFDRRCDPHNIWEIAATRANSAYKIPPRNITNNIMKMEDVETMMRNVGFVNVKGVVKAFKFVDTSRPGIDGIMHFFWESGNPMALERIQSFEGYGDLADVKREMKRALEEDFDSGEDFYVDLAFIVGTKEG